MKKNKFKKITAFLSSSVIFVAPITTVVSCSLDKKLFEEDKTKSVSNKKPVDTIDKKPTDTIHKKPTDTIHKKPVDTTHKKPVDTTHKKPVDTKPKQKKPVDTKPKHKKPEKKADIVISKPTKSFITITGKNGSGAFTIPTIEGVDVSFNTGHKNGQKPVPQSGQLSNGDWLLFKFTLKPGYVWDDGSTTDVSFLIDVKGLGQADTEIDAPTENSLKSMLKINGHNGSGTFIIPTITGTDVRIASGIRSGQLSNGDTLSFDFALKPGYVWRDGSHANKRVSVKVSGLETDTKISKPTESILKPMLNISGHSDSGTYDMPTIQGADVTVIGKPSGQLSNWDILTFEFTLKPGYVWSNGSHEKWRVNVEVDGLETDTEIEKPTEYSVIQQMHISGKDDSGTYNMPTIQGADVTVIGKPSGQLSNWDLLTFEFTLKPGYVWDDGTYEKVSVNVEVKGLGQADTEIDAPTENSLKSLLNIHGHNGSGTYNMPTIQGVNVRRISGNDSGQLSNGDDLMFGFTLKPGYIWSDGTNGVKFISIRVNNLATDTKISMPTESSVTQQINIDGENGSGTYNMPTIQGANVVLVTGKPSGQLSNNDYLVFRFTLKPGYIWSDGSKGDVGVQVNVSGLKEKSIVKPTKPAKTASKFPIDTVMTLMVFSGENGRGKLTQNNSIKGMLDFAHISMRIQGQNFSNGDVAKFIFTPQSGYTWEDGTTTAVIKQLIVKGLSSKPKGQKHTRNGQTHTNFIPFADFSLNSTARNSAGSYIRNNLKSFIAGFVIMDNYGNPSMKDWSGSTLGDVSSIGNSGVNVGISFGGAHGTSPSVYAASNGRSADWLYNKYVDIIERVDNIKYVDWDVEGAAAGNYRASRLRSDAIKRLRKRYPKLKLSVTVATAPTGILGSVWNYVVKPLKGSINNVNIMAMDYGYRMSDSAMLDAAKSATRATANRLAREGWVDENNKYSMVGLIPMIGKNDTPGETFTLDSARKLAEWAVKVHLGTLSMWSITRDENLGDPVLNTHIGTSAFAFANAMKVVEDQEWDFSGSTSDGSGSGSGSGNNTNNQNSHTDESLTQGISPEKDGWNPWITPSSGGDKSKAKQILATFLAGRSLNLRWGHGRGGTVYATIASHVYEDGIRGIWRNKTGAEATGEGTIFDGWGLGGDAPKIKQAAKTIIDFLRRSFPEEIGKN